MLAGRLAAAAAKKRHVTEDSSKYGARPDLVYEAVHAANWERVEALTAAHAKEKATAAQVFESMTPSNPRVTLATRLNVGIKNPPTALLFSQKIDFDLGSLASSSTTDTVKRERKETQAILDARAKRKLRPAVLKPPLRGAACTVDASNRTALHMAAECHAPPAAIAGLLLVQPAAAKARDHYSNTPLHLAASGGLHLAKKKVCAVNLPLAVVDEAFRARRVVQLLVHAAPETAAWRNREARTPLEMAVRCQRWHVVTDLVNASAVSATIVARADDDLDDGPLYADARRHHAPESVLASLLDVHPKSEMSFATLLKNRFYAEARAHLGSGMMRSEALRTPDAKGRLPLHLLAADADAPEDLIALVVAADPKGLHHRDADGQRPTEVSIRTDARKTKLFRLATKESRKTDALEVQLATPSPSGHVRTLERLAAASQM